LTSHERQAAAPSSHIDQGIKVQRQDEGTLASEVGGTAAQNFDIICSEHEVASNREDVAC